MNISLVEVIVGINEYKFSKVRGRDISPEGDIGNFYREELAFSRL